MYINDKYNLTCTPSAPIAAYNTWPQTAPRGDWYQHVPIYYIDQNGRVQKWSQWTPPQTVLLGGGMYKGTPTRTGGFYAPNIGYM